MSVVSSVSTESLIDEIKKERAIWDTTCDEYAIKQHKDDAWNRVISNVFEGDEKTDLEKLALVESLQKKWKNIRTCFTRELSKQRTDGLKGGRPRRPYLHYEQLKFLEPIVKYISTHSSKGEEEGEECEEQVVEWVLPVQSEESPPKKPRIQKQELEPTSIARHSLARETEADFAEEEDDRLFLLSLVSEMKRVPKEKKIKVKTDILMAISNCQQF